MIMVKRLPNIIEKVKFMEKINTRLFSNRQLIRLIIPLVIEQGLGILVDMCDGVMV